MNITFINKSNKNIYISIGHSDTIINSGELKTVDTDDADTFTVQVNEGSYITYILENFGIVLKRHFKIASEYSFTTDKDLTVTLLSEKQKGKFMDEYERVLCRADNNSLALLSFGVPDEEKLKKELEAANKRADNTIKIFDLFDILGNGISAALLLLIPFVIICIIADIELAGKICTMAFIPIFALIIYLNRFFDKIKRHLWKTAKGVKLKNQIFKDYNSYFDSEYIASVFKK